MKKVPVLFIIFNRPELSLETFKAIKKYQPNVLYIAADGPRSWVDGETEVCTYTRQLILEQIDWDCEVHKLFRDKNVGCGFGPSSGISWMFEKEEYGIIIEDDCTPSSDFFKFCEELLPKYAECHQIMQINGFNPAAKNITGNSYSFSRYPKIWGWATWKRAWKDFDIKMSEWPKYKKSNKIWKQFPLLEGLIHKYIWERSFRELNSTDRPNFWDIPWSITIFSKDGLCIVPDVNMVVNTGEGVNATNCIIIDPNVSKLKYGKMDFPLIHPQETLLTKETNQEDQKDYMNRRKSLLKQKIKRFFKLKAQNI